MENVKEFITEAGVPFVVIEEAPKIDIFKTDLENLAEVKTTCNQLKNYNIDYLILNAGAYKITRKTTDLGFDNIFQINFISQYYLVEKLIKT